MSSPIFGKLTGVLGAFKKYETSAPIGGGTAALRRVIATVGESGPAIRRSPARFYPMCLTMGRSAGRSYADGHREGKSDSMEVPSHYFAGLCKESLTAAHLAPDLHQRIAFLDAAIWFAEAAFGAVSRESRPKRSFRVSVKAH